MHLSQVFNFVGHCIIHKLKEVVTFSERPKNIIRCTIEKDKFPGKIQDLCKVNHIIFWDTLNENWKLI